MKSGPIRFSAMDNNTKKEGDPLSCMVSWLGKLPAALVANPFFTLLLSFSQPTERLQTEKPLKSVVNLARWSN